MFKTAKEQREMPNEGSLKRHRFPKGVSGNPGGRPKTKAFAQALRQEIAEADDDQDVLRQIANTLLEKAAGGDIQAIKEVADRLDGKPLAMTADVTDRLDELTDEELDAAISALRASIESAGKASSEETQH